MRHVYIRAILAVIWTAAAVAFLVNGSLPLAAFDLAMGALCAYSAYAGWKREKG